MSEFVEDRPPSGEGMPSEVEVIETRDYLKRRNRDAGTRPTALELVANGFSISHSSVGRILKKVAGGVVPTRDKKRSALEKRELNRKDKAKAETKRPKRAPKPEGLTAGELTSAEIMLLKDIIGTPEALKKNCDIALVENKVRMGLNIILMHRMIAKPDLLLLDMRSTAALIDSLTVSSKLSGGASFEVIAHGDKPEIDGRGMKDITPDNPNVAAIDDFRRFRLNGNGKD